MNENGSLTYAKRNKIDIRIFPRPRRGRIHFMHDPQMRMLMHSTIPPIPCLTMFGRSAECVESFDRSPVRENNGGDVTRGFGLYKHAG